jgi:formamidopyrimidine-DNA glycosylase
MPELPEVETVTRDLRPLLVGRLLVSIKRSRKSLRQVWTKSWDARIIGRRVEAIHRRGKWILLTLDGGGFLMVHLGMTGQFTVAAAGTKAQNHTHVVFPLDNEHELRFRDVRRFGSIAYFADQPSWESYLAERLGPEPWDLPEKTWRMYLKQTRRPIKAVLLDQTAIAGVGNIYADEACFAARIDPRRAGNTLRPAAADRLLRSIRDVLDRAIESRGSTIRDYVGGSGLRGGYQLEFAVYGRKGEPCVKCGRAIECVRLAGRSTHFCPACQK